MFLFMVVLFPLFWHLFFYSALTNYSYMTVKDGRKNCVVFPGVYGPPPFTVCEVWLLSPGQLWLLPHRNPVKLHLRVANHHAAEKLMILRQVQGRMHRGRH